MLAMRGGSDISPWSKQVLGVKQSETQKQGQNNIPRREKEEGSRSVSG